MIVTVLFLVAVAGDFVWKMNQNKPIIMHMMVSLPVYCMMSTINVGCSMVLKLATVRELR